MIPPIVERVGDELRINLFPKQVEFVNSEIDDLFFGGQAGPGKSSAIIAGAALRRMRHPGSKGLILRRTFPELEKSLIQKSREVYPAFGATYHESNKVWKFPNGSLQYFGYCETDKDVYQFQSAEYQDIWFDEASHFTHFQISYISSRCRSTIPGCKAILRLASNPGNTGHHYLKKRYIEPAKMSKTWTDEKTGKTLGFIPAKLEDNPAMMELDPTYKNRLRELGEQKYMALAEGSWDVFEGAFFDFDIRPGMGVLPYRRVPDTDTFKFLSLDWGYAEPACVLWWELMPSGRLIAYRELYVTKLSPGELAKRIVEMSPSSERYEYIACPPEIWGKKVELEGGGQSIQELMQPIFSDKIPMQRAPNARVPGWLKLKGYMRLAGDGKPWLQISPVCENLIRTIPTMMYSDKPGRDPEDSTNLAEDHACLVGESLVQTDLGEKRIDELVGLEGKIWTDKGRKDFTGVQKTRENAEVFKVTLDSGESLIATADHKLMTPDGMKQIKDLAKGSFITIQSDTWKQLLSLIRFKNSMVSDIISVVTIFKRKASAFIELFGNSIMVQFPLATTFTIPTDVDTTTQFRTSNFYRARNTWRTMVQICLPNKSWRARRIFYLKPFPKQESGINLKTEENGIQKMPNNLGRRGNFLTRFVKFVVKSIKHGTRVSQDSVALIAKCAHSALATKKSYATMIESVGRRDVYNLCVKDIHRYFVNGSFLSGNCDSARYAVMTLQNIPKLDSQIISPYEQLFGISTQQKNQAHLPMTNRGGY